MRSTTQDPDVAISVNAAAAFCLAEESDVEVRTSIDAMCAFFFTLQRQVAYRISLCLLRLARADEQLASLTVATAPKLEVLLSAEVRKLIVRSAVCMGVVDRKAGVCAWLVLWFLWA